jgi:hypothetical protein
MFLLDESHHLVVSEQLPQLGHIHIAKACIVQAAGEGRRGGGSAQA